MPRVKLYPMLCRIHRLAIYPLRYGYRSTNARSMT